MNTRQATFEKRKRETTARDCWRRGRKWRWVGIEV